MNSPSDHGRGYTWLSMRSTPRRWRRRIGVTRDLEQVRVDGRHRAAAIERALSRVDQLISASGLRRYSGCELPRLHELLAQAPAAWASCTSDDADG